MSENTTPATNPEAGAPPAAAPAAATKPRTNKPAPAAATTAPAPVVGVLPKRRNRHEVTFEHDVFVSTPANGIRNVGYEHLNPVLIEIDHKHIYHSHDTDGKPLKRTGSNIGHWHEVTRSVDPVTGDLIATCGPPMHEVDVVGESGRSYKNIEQVGFEREIQVGDNKGKKERVMDNHTHKLDYLGSETMTPAGIQKMLEAQRGEAAAHGINLAGAGIKNNTPVPLTPADGIEVR